jgi:hypothetical protein
VTAPARAEDVAEQVPEAAAALSEQVAEVEPTATAPGGGAGEAATPVELAELVVLLALGLVTHDVVGLGDLLELLVLGGVTGVGVGVDFLISSCVAVLLTPSSP